MDKSMIDHAKEVPAFRSQRPIGFRVGIDDLRFRMTGNVRAQVGLVRRLVAGVATFQGEAIRGDELLGALFRDGVAQLPKRAVLRRFENLDQARCSAWRCPGERA